MIALTSYGNKQHQHQTVLKQVIDDAPKPLNRKQSARCHIAGATPSRLYVRGVEALRQKLRHPAE